MTTPMRAFVINLTRSVDRRASMASQLMRLGVDYDLVQAVDGRELDMADPAILDAIAPSFLNADWWRPAHAACAMSHLKVYHRVIAEGLEAALILEDDVQLPADIYVLAANTAKGLSGAEIALFNFESPDPIEFVRDRGLALPSGRRLVAPVDAGQPVSGAAYLITSEACQRIMEAQTPIRAKADNWAYFYRQGVLDMVRCVLPMPVVKDPRFESTIGYNTDTSLKTRALGLMSHSTYLREAVSRRRQRIWRKYTRIEMVDDPAGGSD
jgi:glycosyl transferase, family 25